MTSPRPLVEDFDENVVARSVREAFDRIEIPPRPATRFEADASTVAGATVPSVDDERILSPARSRRRVWYGVVAVAASVGGLIWSVIGAPPSAFAEITDGWDDIRDVRFVMKQQHDGRPDTVAVVTLRRPHQVRIDFTEPAASVNITNHSTGELIAFQPRGGPVTITETGLSDGGDVLDQVRAVDDDWKIDPEEELPGVDCYVHTGEIDWRVWIRRSTGRPFRVVLQIPASMGGARTVFSDFDYDIDVPSDFFDPPGDRTIVREDMPSPTETHLVQAFAAYRRLTDQPPPNDFLGGSETYNLGALAYDRTLSRDENRRRQSLIFGDHLEAIGMTPAEAATPGAIGRRIDVLHMSLDQWNGRVERGNAAFLGGDRFQTDTPMLWYRNDDGDIRVLNGRLDWSTTEAIPE